MASQNTPTDFGYLTLWLDPEGESIMLSLQKGEKPVVISLDAATRLSQQLVRCVNLALALKPASPESINGTE